MVPPTSRGCRPRRQISCMRQLRVAHKFAGRVARRGIADVDQMMGNARAQRARTGLGGADVHAAIHQRGIDADDFQRQLFRQASPPESDLPAPVGPINSTADGARLPGVETPGASASAQK